jgi:hypothetical protein
VTTSPLLGVVGWERTDWQQNYYPTDLPAEWRLSYLANDADCVLLPAQAWYHGLSSAAAARLDAALSEAPEGLSFLLAVTADAPPPSAALARFAGRNAGLLVEGDPLLPRDLPRWQATGAGSWVGEDGSTVSIWHLASTDLGEWRRRAESLDSNQHALLLDGPAASPASVIELRTLLQLLGLA